jgi:hypothetical protein
MKWAKTKIFVLFVSFLVPILQAQADDCVDACTTGCTQTCLDDVTNLCMTQNPSFPPAICAIHPGYQPQRNLCSDFAVPAQNSCKTSCVATNCTADTTAPTIAISTSDANLANGETATITFTISEDVSDFVVDDITVTGGTLSDFIAVSASNYTVSYTANAATGSVSVADGAFRDAAGNSNTSR